MRKIFALSLCLLLLFVGTAHANTKVAVFSAQEVLMKSDAYTFAKQKFTKEFAPKEKEIADKRAAIEKLQQTIGTKRPTPKQQEELEKLQREYNQLANAYVQHVRRAEMEVKATIDTMIIKAAETIAKSKGYDIVMDSAACAFVKKSIDITPDVLAQVNKLWKERPAQ